MLSRIRLCLGKIASTWQASTSTEPRGVVRHRQSTVGSTAELSWKPKILKPTPIGHFAEFSLRAHKLPPAFTRLGDAVKDESPYTSTPGIELYHSKESSKVKRKRRLTRCHGMPWATKQDRSQLN